ncbi:MAG: hypothetical protein A3C80_01955 [Candidatus Ryanbacteria bacterium RIFCSPHIGHO2_02_FULL_45_43]|uniref:Multidrug ABC transporter substrate-binding protein n=1 Tax=Candidatus Ryanbacteria bacterium RIFCSPHIGHO2_01_45_13 TaxID=1802112 RepID=A0A1G2FY37_9BACT|nr:MAG: hypothetical protein A2718_02785 [Candidatus Ryanbacteria bacterium RIFCSPHIGHO2_01_FULL_44_130]OGZ43004.1 MAG: hypothetical protein A2W41_02730 [Candidatus Ryanbacteria bacterium RIFCSPHIGHO2_01_45_13]OGZ48709.1 MAG: hypothetical protein A3C80_01955 [Candidatus Ryanbacteria bacterium RIFCSPHIGHO2_02_FULL_45_43]OGZ50649.1 MAG: hypothetical protein A3E55_03435 [Candidatus Ryanbacteria bacterium RIFCSPHIGHO2_12_FULL_44_20]OGZ51955.1 MAG: hypothetical protein A3A17_00810 [Candidatus Ryanba
MNIKHGFKTAIRGVGAQKSRSALTILGIVIGITSIILMMSIGRGAEALILNELGALGAEMIVIRPGQEPKGPAEIAETIFADSLKIRDVEALQRKNNVPGIVNIAPVVIVPGSVSYKNETFAPTIFGWSAEFFTDLYGIYPEEGTIFDENDIRQRSSVALIGPKVKEELFGESEAIGQNIKIKDRKFKVVGVLPKRGQVSFVNMDELVIIPYTTAQTYLLGIDYYNEVVVKAASPDAVKQTVYDIEVTLRAMHGITDTDKDDFFVVTQEGITKQVSSIIGALTIFLSSVVAIALVVAGIGVMNIMLVSVTERTREVGLRKAIGATNKDIMMQFLMEAMILTGVGGMIGIVVGAFFSYAASFLLGYYYSNLQWSFTFPISAAILGLVVSTFVGLVFGLYPAVKASKKSPIEALRYE